ncbi:hypothetical protein fugu_018517 [Takifugu bimaculatus]|uniref:Extracellular matrix protein 1a n=1 Tax=Takifugu bimaculatus TaxID=433685 RepID=A0A4Z2BLD9_9TELE|nr:hypothetical protein fugu_018517 [Takifugu bimaculatus]
MILTGSLTGCWITALILTLPSANMGEKGKANSLGEPIIPFPPALPTCENLSDICQSGDARPRYLTNFFPKSGASHFRRRGKAINRMESWLSQCCAGEAAEGNTQVLCCAQQAWKQALALFCMEEYATMTTAYHCCEQSGAARWLCFDGAPSKRSYSPTAGYTAPALPEEPGFTFDANTC